jgi:hypothetical protein
MSDASDTMEEFEETTPPRDVRIERETRDMYEALQNDDGSPYEGAQLLKIFINAAAAGSYQGLRQPLDGDKQALFNVSSLSDKHHTYIRSIAWHETHDESIYYDQKRAFNIAMEFANGGIRYLHRNHLGIGDNTSEVSTQQIQRWQELEQELSERGLLNTTD